MAQLRFVGKALARPSAFWGLEFHQKIFSKWRPKWWKIF